MVILSSLIDLNLLALEEGKLVVKKRFCYFEVEKLLEEQVFTGIVGPRGAGKTVLLKQLLANTPNSFYISLDSYVLDAPLFEIARALFEKQGVKTLFLDEVQFLPNFQGELKKIYDFLKVKIVFTGSCALAVYNSKYDLARRVRLIHAPVLSFREFIYFKKGIALEKISLSELIDEQSCKEAYSRTFTYEHLFEEYLRGACFPFAINIIGSLQQLYLNNLEKVISNDFIKTGEISLDEVNTVKAVVKFVALSKIDGISYSNISSNLKITKYKAQKYVELLEKAFILNQVFPIGTNVTKEPKVTMSIPYRLTYAPIEIAIGAIREDFFTTWAKEISSEVFYLKSQSGEKTPDYQLGNAVIEIGGKNKSTSQFKGVTVKNRIILSHPSAIDETHRPLYLFGFVEKNNTIKN